jgi:NTE family protein
MSRTGLVLGGGGIVGQAYHGAVLAGIEVATGWDPRDAEVVVGTSAGSASGAELRAGLSGADMAARRAGRPFSREGQELLVALGPPPQVRPFDVEVDVDRARAAFRRLALRTQLVRDSVPPGVLTSVAMSPGRMSASWLTRQVEWLNGGTGWPGRDFWCCAVDLDDGSRVVFGRPGEPPAEPGQAVAASCAIPGVFAPVEIHGRLYIDGGGWSPTNADVLADLGLDLVIVVSPMSAVPGCALERRDFVVRRACRSLLMREIAAVRASGTPVVVVEPVEADLRAMGRLIGIDVLDEGRCDAVVEQVTASTVARVRDGSIAGFGRLPVAQLLAA